MASASEETACCWLCSGLAEIKASKCCESGPKNDPTARFKLDDDPLAVLAVNDRHRRESVTDREDLWDLGQVRAEQPRQYIYPVPTFVPIGRHVPPMPAYMLPTQEEYSSIFDEKFPPISKILPIENIVVAGGAAAWPLTQTGADGDVDLFVYGIDPTDERALWSKLQEVTRRIMCACVSSKPTTDSDSDSISQVLTPGVLTIQINRKKKEGAHGHTYYALDESRSLKIQVVLRAYSSISAILHAFDVPAACVAYDGHRMYTTSLGAYAHLFRANIVNPNYRSTTYEQRLKKYFSRGFALVLPHLEPSALQKGGTLHLPHIHLETIIKRGNLAAGRVHLPPGVNSAESDYANIVVSVEKPRLMGPDYLPRIVDEDVLMWGLEGLNYRRVIAGDHRFFITASVCLELLINHSERMVKIHPIDLDSCEMIDFDDVPKDFHKIITREDFNHRIVGWSRAVMDRMTGRIHVRLLRDVFGLTDTQLFKFVDAVIRAIKEARTNNIDVIDALKPFTARLWEKYDSVPTTLEWWIKTDAGRQYTASINPRMEDPATWYAAYLNPECKAIRKHHLSDDDNIRQTDDSRRIKELETQVEALVGTLELQLAEQAASSSEVYGTSCMVCFDELTIGGPNTLVLPCGHLFHWGLSKNGCEGFVTWVTKSKDNNTCPACKSKFVEKGIAMGSGPPARRQPVRLAVEW